MLPQHSGAIILVIDAWIAILGAFKSLLLYGIKLPVLARAN